MIFVFLGILTTFDGPVVQDISLLYESVASRPAAKFVTGGQSMYMYFPEQNVRGASRIFLWWRPL